MKTILITGAAGGIATQIRPLLREHYRLRLSDRAPVRDPTPEETVTSADLGDIEALRRAVSGVDGILHLGGYAVEADWDIIHDANIVGCYNLFEAARLEGVKRIVFASSNHAVGYYPRAETIGIDVPVRPDTRYGLSKAFGEALGALYAHKYGAEVLSIRIGNVIGEPSDRRRLAIWQSPRDFVQLVRIGLEHPDIRHEIVYGMSDNKRAWWDNRNAYRLGYRPMDRSEDHAEKVLANDKGPSGDPRIRPQPGRSILYRGSDLIPAISTVRPPFTPIIHTRQSCLPSRAFLAIIQGRDGDSWLLCQRPLTSRRGPRAGDRQGQVASFFACRRNAFYWSGFFRPGRWFLQTATFIYLLESGAGLWAGVLLFGPCPAPPHALPRNAKLDAPPASHAKMTG